MRFGPVFGGIALFLAACAAPASEPEPETLGGSHQAIVGGSASPASQDATVLISERGRALCSGTLIAPNLVLTARHCISDYDENSDCGTIVREAQASNLTIATGADADERTVVARGANVYVPNTNQLCSADIALLSLDKDVANITPAKVSFAAASKDGVGTAIGYGGDTPRTTRSDVKILAVGPTAYSYRTRDGQSIVMDPMVNEIVTSESTCFGDSGGPLLDDQGRVFAVASRSFDNVCRDRAAFWTTLSGHEQLIRNAANAVGHPMVDPTGAPSTGGKTAVAGNNASPNGNTDDSSEDGSSKKKKSGGSNNQIDSAGCTSAPRAPSSPVTALLGVGLALAIVRRRSRSLSCRPSLPSRR